MVEDKKTNLGQISQTIRKVLNNDDRLWDEERKVLNETLLLELVENADEKIIDLLLQEKSLKEKFFIKIKDIYVFKTNDFRFFIEETKVENSYTAYANRIGLTDGKKFLKDTNDVVLDYPYKDCILEGGQSTEEGMDVYFEYDESVTNAQEKNGMVAGGYNKKTAKRKEIFFNQVLAHDEIDRLFEPKSLVNWKRYTKEGELEVKEIKRDKNGAIKENLVIKGNNLLALHSIKKSFAGKVNLIYIDPPFNTGNDTFVYNDNFSRSTWLTFMKNRLEIARELLSEDGNFFIHIDINQVHYIKPLCDDIFGEQNFIEELIWAYGSPSGGRAAGAKPVNVHDYILHYSKNYSQRKQFKTYIPYSKKYIKDWFKYEDPDGRKYQRRMRGKDSEGKSVWTKQYLDESKGVPLSTVWTDIKQVYADPRAYKDNQSKYTELEKSFTGGQKPEALLKRIIEMCTNEGDLILDYHLGTGTTAVVAHKMKRVYIGIEQMDYIDNYTVKRLKSTIKGDEKGVSKKLDWKGGGDFIYLEIAKWNEVAKDMIIECKNFEELLNLFDEMYNKYFLNYNLRIKEFKEKVIQEEEFKKLSLSEQKKMFIAMLDNNQMCVNMTEMADKKYGIDKKDQNITLEFYKK